MYFVFILYHEIGYNKIYLIYKLDDVFKYFVKIF